jgi:pyrroline-5-carboxylate reductase
MKIVYIGGGNMAAALIGGGLKAGRAATDTSVVEVDAGRRDELARLYSVATQPQPDAALAGADIIVLAVKPQQMREACLALRPFVGDATVLSIAAGIRTAELTRWLGTTRIVRAMPNTPALIGQGITGLAALPSVPESSRRQVEAILQSAGPVLWLDAENKLDAVTALSGSGPAYIFYVIEAMMQAGRELGLADTESRQLAVQTVIGAGRLASASTEPVSLLRERVTSKGGTTAAGLACLAAGHVDEAIVRAVLAAFRRAVELGDEFGAQSASE